MLQQQIASRQNALNTVFKHGQITSSSLSAWLLQGSHHGGIAGANYAKAGTLMKGLSAQGSTATPKLLKLMKQK